MGRVDGEAGARGVSRRRVRDLEGGARGDDDERRGARNESTRRDEETRGERLDSIQLDGLHRRRRD